MEKLERYRNYIQELFSEYARLSPSDDEAETQIVFDTQRDHYQVVSTGWKNRISMYGCVLHLDIKGEKIWIQHDGTEIGIADYSSTSILTIIYLLMSTYLKGEKMMLTRWKSRLILAVK